MSGRASKQKGSRFELAVAKALGGVRVPMSGAVAAFPGDVVANLFGKRVRIECKKRATGFKQIYAWLRDNFMLVIGADRMDPLAVLRLADLIAAEDHRRRIEAENERLTVANKHLKEEVMRLEYKYVLTPVGDDTPDTPADWGRTGN